MTKLQVQLSHQNAIIFEAQ